jgi:hypothetical protein
MSILNLPSGVTSKDAILALFNDQHRCLRMVRDTRLDTCSKWMLAVPKNLASTLSTLICQVIGSRWGTLWISPQERA